jgi:hypothetical protein
LEGIAAVNVTGKKLSIMGPVISVKPGAASRAMTCCKKPANLANLAGGRGILFITVALISLYWMWIRTETEFKIRQWHIHRRYGWVTPEY